MVRRILVALLIALALLSACDDEGTTTVQVTPVCGDPLNDDVSC